LPFPGQTFLAAVGPDVMVPHGRRCPSRCQSAPRPV
jgi:hypothetical protein